MMGRKKATMTDICRSLVARTVAVRGNRGMRSNHLALLLVISAFAWPLPAQRRDCRSHQHHADDQFFRESREGEFLLHEDHRSGIGCGVAAEREAAKGSEYSGKNHEGGTGGLHRLTAANT